MIRDPAFHQRILEDMTDGVVTVDLAGKIVTFNRAAAAILGLDAAQLLGSTLAEHFFSDQENDDFNQVILDAVYQSQTTHNRVVAYKRHDGLRWLSVTTSFLRAPCEEEAPRNGEPPADGGSLEKLGVIILVDDVTEVEALRAVEAELKQGLESKHKELQAAYLSLEERNRRIEVFTKRARLARYFATALVMALVLGVGGYGWHTGAFSLDSVVGSRTVHTAPAPQSSFTVTPTPISSNIRVVGTIQPGQIVNVVSPFDGVVRDKLFRYGAPVQRGAVVLELDTDELESSLRDARSKHIKAEQQLRKLKNWRNSPEVVRAHRSVLSQQHSVGEVERKMAETKILLDKGIVAAQEYTNLQEQLHSQETQLESAQHDLKVTLDEGNEENLQVAVLEFENAQDALDKLEREFGEAVVRAPVSGIAIMPQDTGDSSDPVPIEIGSKVTTGAPMFSIADLEALTVDGVIDEIDVGKVVVGQPVTVTGDAFVDYPMTGEVVAVSSQAASEQAGGDLPKFPLTARIGVLTPPQRQNVRIGMSAYLDIQIGGKPDALIVPTDALHSSDGQSWLLRRDPKTGAVGRVEVTTGPTTLLGVEILSGLQPGDVIILGSAEGGES